VTKKFKKRVTLVAIKCDTTYGHIFEENNLCAKRAQEILNGKVVHH
jgi:hypothetical protein